MVRADIDGEVRRAESALVHGRGRARHGDAEITVLLLPYSGAHGAHGVYRPERPFMLDSLAGDVVARW